MRGITPPCTPPPRNTTAHDTTEHRRALARAQPDQLTTEQPRRGTAEETCVWGAAPHLDTTAPRHHPSGHRRAS
ncbi:hypothetical protein ACFWG0_16220 [Streptomyces yangpuensis]|uniref:hypothetical protein n=1 Tax=Streptomyces yangpuensis TaxID=1648182 RepID=UPI0036677F29